MKHFFLYTIIGAFFFSCTRTDCSLKNIQNVKWKPLDQSADYCLCQSSSRKLQNNDSVTIELLGKIKAEDDVFITDPVSEGLLSNIFQVNKGIFLVSDSSLPQKLHELILSMNKNSTCIVRCNPNEAIYLAMPRKFTVYFERSFDSATAISSLKRSLTDFQVDSIVYTSKNEAIEKYMQDNDSTWNDFINENPLPTSADVYLPEAKFDSITLNGLKQQLIKASFISEVQLPPLLKSGLGEMHAQWYYVRIKS